MAKETGTVPIKTIQLTADDNGNIIAQAEYWDPEQPPSIFVLAKSETSRYLTDYSRALVSARMLYHRRREERQTQENQEPMELPELPPEPQTPRATKPAAKTEKPRQAAPASPVFDEEL